MKCDSDHNGRIDINEFIDQYLVTKNQLLERQLELKQSILENSRNLKLTEQQVNKNKILFANKIIRPCGTLEVKVEAGQNFRGV